MKILSSIEVRRILEGLKGGTTWSIYTGPHITRGRPEGSPEAPPGWYRRDTRATSLIPSILPISNRYLSTLALYKAIYSLS